MNATSEYIQEEGTRSAKVFRNQHSSLVVVMCMDGEDVVQDHICEDLQTAEDLAEDWVTNGTTEEDREEG